MAGRPLYDVALEPATETDIVIPVMGPTKAGKSSFLNQLLGTPVFKVGVKLASCTEVITTHVVQEAPQEYTQLNKLLTNRRLVLVDTPGFDDTHMGDEVVLSRISGWLTRSYKNGMLVGGVLYLHDITGDGSLKSQFKGLTLFTKLCGRDFMDQVAFITTKWDRLHDSREGNDRVAELSEGFWKQNMDDGARLFHLQPESVAFPLSCFHKRPWEIIHHLVVAAATRDVEYRILRIQDEIVNEKRFLPETDAGRELRMSLADLLRKADDLKRRAREDTKAGKPTDSLEMRQQEIDKIVAQLKAMRPPGFFTRAKRFLAFLTAF